MYILRIFRSHSHSLSFARRCRSTFPIHPRISLPPPSPPPPTPLMHIYFRNIYKYRYIRQKCTTHAHTSLPPSHCHCHTMVYRSIKIVLSLGNDNKSESMARKKVIFIVSFVQRNHPHHTFKPTHTRN